MENKSTPALKGSQITIKCLEKLGVEVVFAYPGGQAIELHQALQDSTLRVILPRHEQGGAFAANGYARATGKVGVAMATSGPGATNLLTGIADAYMDSVPTVFITGQVPLASIGKNAFDLFKAIDWKALGTNLINLAKNGITGLAEAIPSALKSVGSAAMKAFKNIDWKSLGSAVISGIKAGIKAGASAIIEAAKDVAESALNAAKSFLGIHSPSRVFKEQVGEQISAGEAEGITANTDMVEDAVKDVQKNALDASMDVNYNLPSTDSVSQEIGASFSSRVMETVNRVIEVPLNINGREVARATAWDMGEQLAWESR